MSCLVDIQCRVTRFKGFLGADLPLNNVIRPNLFTTYMIPTRLLKQMGKVTALLLEDAGGGCQLGGLPTGLAARCSISGQA